MQRLIQKIVSCIDRSPGSFRGNVLLFELNRRFLWFVVFRFAVVVTFALLSIFGSLVFPSIGVTSRAFLVMAALLLVANLAYWTHYTRAAKTADQEACAGRITFNVRVQIVLDFLVLGYLAYRCGGIESPLVYFFLFHNVICCLFFRKLVSLAFTVLSLIIVYVVSLLPRWGIGTVHHFIFPSEAQIFYGNAAVSFYQLAGLTTCFLVVWFCVASITDSLKRNERWLQDKIDELVEMDKERTRYLLVTTHELKAPFSSIQSYVNVLLGGYAGDLSDKTRDVLWKIKTRCELLMRMITEMLQLANINALKERKTEIAKTRVDIVKILGTAIARFKETAASKNVKFVWPEGEVHKILANAEQMDILINNILSNAVSYCYSDTSILIEMRESAKLLLITVADKGIGIRKENLGKVFLEYFRSEEAAAMNRSSTGLGLSIAKQIVDIHGGKMWIESVSSVGTTVFMELPKGAQAPS